MIKTKYLILSAFILTLMACAEGNSEKLSYSKTHSYGSTYALQFISKKDDVTVAFDLQRKEITVKGLEDKYLIKFSDVKSISYTANGASGMLAIQTSDKSNEIGIIDRVDFNVFAEEMKSSIPSLKLESL
jgi:hypothetical protein